MRTSIVLIYAVSLTPKNVHYAIIRTHKTRQLNPPRVEKQKGIHYKESQSQDEVRGVAFIKHLLHTRNFVCTTESAKLIKGNRKENRCLLNVYIAGVPIVFNHQNYSENSFYYLYFTEGSEEQSHLPRHIELLSDSVRV